MQYVLELQYLVVFFLCKNVLFITLNQRYDNGTDNDVIKYCPVRTAEKKDHLLVLVKVVLSSAGNNKTQELRSDTIQLQELSDWLLINVYNIANANYFDNRLTDLSLWNLFTKEFKKLGQRSNINIHNHKCEYCLQIVFIAANKNRKFNLIWVRTIIGLLSPYFGLRETIFTILLETRQLDHKSATKLIACCDNACRITFACCEINCLTNTQQKQGVTLTSTLHYYYCWCF